MNAKRFRVIFSRVLNRPVVTSELQKSQGKAGSKSAQSSAQIKPSASKLASMVLALSAVCSFQANAQSILPTGGVVAPGGTATIDNTNPNVMTINQTSQNAVINWDTFNIAHGHEVHFNHQEGATAATLNRVVGTGGQSVIDGSLNANGRVFLLNPNGVLFGSTANVNVGGLVASTQNMTDDSFMNRGYAFTAQDNTITGANIINNGLIAAQGVGGFVVLASNGKVTNTGTLSATNGTVQMAQGNEFTLTMPSNTNPFLSLQLTGSANPSGNIGVHNNKGTIEAANIELKAQNGWVKSTAGVINATSILDLVAGPDVADRNGSAYFVAKNGPALFERANIRAGKDIVVAGMVGGVDMRDVNMFAGRDIIVEGKADYNHGIYSRADSMLALRDIKFEGKSTNYTGVVVVKSLSARRNLTLNGESWAGVGVYVDSALRSDGYLNISGISDKGIGTEILSGIVGTKGVGVKGESINDVGIFMDRNSISSLEDINIYGRSKLYSGTRISSADLTSEGGSINIEGYSRFGPSAVVIKESILKSALASSIIGEGDAAGGVDLLQNQLLGKYYHIVGKSEGGVGVAIHANGTSTFGSNISMLGESVSNIGIVIGASSPLASFAFGGTMTGNSTNFAGISLSGVQDVNIVFSPSAHVQGSSSFNTGLNLAGMMPVQVLGGATLAGISNTGTGVIANQNLTLHSDTTVTGSSQTGTGFEVNGQFVVPAGAILSGNSSSGIDIISAGQLTVAYGGTIIADSIKGDYTISQGGSYISKPVTVTPVAPVNPVVVAPVSPVNPIVVVPVDPARPVVVAKSDAARAASASLWNAATPQEKTQVPVDLFIEPNDEEQVALVI